MPCHCTECGPGFLLQGQQAVAFERFMAFRKSGGNHCHINVVPVPVSAAKTARAIFDRAAAAIGAEFTELPRSSGEVRSNADHNWTPAATSACGANCDTIDALGRLLDLARV